MPISTEEALRRVPETAQNRVKLAELLKLTDEVCETLQSDLLTAEWHRRLERIAGLVLLFEAEPKHSDTAHKAYSHLRDAVEAARVHARRHGLHPNTRKGIYEHTRAVVDAAR